MAKTTSMKLLELIVLKNDIKKVLEYLGKKEVFQFCKNKTDSDFFISDAIRPQDNSSQDIYEQLKNCLKLLDLSEDKTLYSSVTIPTNEDLNTAHSIIKYVYELNEKLQIANENKICTNEILKKIKSFAKLKIDFNQLEHLTKIFFKVGQIEPSLLQNLIKSINNQEMIIPLNDDNTKILAISLNNEYVNFESILQKHNFIEFEIPKNFKGVPAELILAIEDEVNKKNEAFMELFNEKQSYVRQNKEIIQRLECSFSLDAQISQMQNNLECTQLVCRLSGWVPSDESQHVISGLDKITSGRIAIRQYNPQEVEKVSKKIEPVPVKLSNKKIVSSFERMIYSYGSPVYGTIDPTPFVAFFFTLLYGLMFGDVGQGLVFVLIGILLSKNLLKFVSSWSKFGPIFICIGLSSIVMGFFTGEFFCNHHILKPFGLWVTGLFGKSVYPILHIMPSGDNIKNMFMFFFFTIGIGFFINSIGLIINIINNINLKHYGKALFGKIGLSGSIFFWYVVFVVIRLLCFNSQINVIDYIIIALSLLGVFFADPLERIVDKEKPILENGLLAAIIAGLVELIELVSTYISNSISFLRVGAFALAHSVLAYIISTLVEMMPNIYAGIVVSIIGNCIVIVLEGMIVAIQVIRLQYYEFFSKFFGQTGVEFKPFKFE